MTNHPNRSTRRYRLVIVNGSVMAPQYFTTTGWVLTPALAHHFTRDAAIEQLGYHRQKYPGSTYKLEEVTNAK